MTVSTTTRKQSFTLDAVTEDFAFTFRALVSTPEDIKCSVTTAGVTTILTYGTNYAVSINSNGIGGTVSLVSTATIGLGTLTVYRETTNTQDSDYDDYNQFPANTLEEDLDKRTIVDQEQSETFDRCIKFPVESSTTDKDMPEPSADKVLGWNTAGTALENKTFIPATDYEKANASDALAGVNDVKYMTPSMSSIAINKIFTTIGTITTTIGTLARAPATNTADYVPLWSGSNTKVLKNGLAVGTAGASTILQLNASGQLPALDGSLLTGIDTLNTKIGVFTHNIETVGTIAITGVGFTPKAVMLLSGFQAAANALSIGIGNSTNNYCSEWTDRTSAATWTQVTSSCIAINVAGGTFLATVASLDADGFTLTGSKSSSPTGVIMIFYLAVG
jgi:hypothetical protein